MIKLFIFLTVLFTISCSMESNENKIGIVIHGGAGTILKENMTPELESAYLQKLEEAVKTGYQILQEGGTSQKAVEETIKIMENSPLFNAGVGAVLTKINRLQEGMAVLRHLLEHQEIKSKEERRNYRSI